MATSASHNEMRQMRVEIAQASADDLLEAVRRIPDEQKAAEIAAQVEHVQQRLRDLDGEQQLYLVEAVATGTGRQVAYAAVHARDRNDALARSVGLLPPAYSADYPQDVYFRCRPCHAGELIYLDPNQGVIWR